MLQLLAALVLVASDPETEEAMRTFMKDYSVPAPAARAAAVTALSRLKTPLVLAKLGTLLVADEEAVRIAAAEGLGAFDLEKEKASALLESALPANAKLFAVEAALLLALGKLGDPSSLPFLHQAFESHEAKDTDFQVAKAALRAAGLVGSRDSIDPLLDLGRRLEKVKKAGGSGGGGKVGIAGGGTPDPQMLRAKALAPVVLKSLQAITQEKWGTLVEWGIWWDRHKTTFQKAK